MSYTLLDLIEEAVREDDAAQSRYTGFERVTQEAFDAYDTENPAIFAKLAEFALQAHRAGAAHIGIGMLYERLRWFTKVESRNDTFKVNNNYRAFYARKLMRVYPELHGIFETRTSKADQP